MARIGTTRTALNHRASIAVVLMLMVLPLAGYAVPGRVGPTPRGRVADVNAEPIWTDYWQERLQLSRLNLEMALQQFQDYQQLGVDTSIEVQGLRSYLDSPTLLGKQVLDQLIDELVTRQEARQRGILVSEEEVQARAQGSVRFFYGGIPVPSTPPAGFRFPTLTADHLARASATAAAAVAPAVVTAGRRSPGSHRDVGVSEATVRAVYEHQLYREKLLAALSNESTTR